MESYHETPRLPEKHSVRGGLAWHGLLLGIVAAPLFGALWAWLAEHTQPYFAPLVLFPLLVGVFVGLSVVALIRIAHIGHRPTILAVTLAAAIVAAIGQHVVGYLDTYYWAPPPVAVGSATDLDISSLVEANRPSFGAYLEGVARHGRPLMLGHVAFGWVVWLTWAIDAVLVVVGALAVTLPAMRVPYCNRCHTWYRPVRHGKIDHRTAQRLAELVGVDAVEPSRSPRYRLSACEGGCGPTRCELSWEDVDGAVSLARVWLNPAKRNQVTAILDGLEGTPSEP